jgi:hypothetical protein
MSEIVEYSSNFKSVVIVGAGRSGTNMLRDALTSLSSFGTWPCDEINYIWRHGNRAHTNDEFYPDMATDYVKNFIRKSFNEMAKETGCEFLVEKTCANSLRVPFVNAVIPDAKYVFIVRNGADVVASAQKRWGAGFDLRYILAKSRYVPVKDIPYYGARYGLHRLKKLISSEKILPSWGPVYAGMRQDLQIRSIEEVCAIQWSKCVLNSEKAFNEICGDRHICLRYEDFVKKPVAKMTEILNFLGAVTDESDIERSVSGVTDKSVGGGVRKLAGNQNLSRIFDSHEVIL